jgi:hypothetical protein
MLVLVAVTLLGFIPFVGVLSAKPVKVTEVCSCGCTEDEVTKTIVLAPDFWKVQS